MRIAALALSLSFASPLLAAGRVPQAVEHAPMAEQSARTPAPAAAPELEDGQVVEEEHELFEALVKHPKKGKLKKPAHHVKEHKKATPAGKGVPFAREWAGGRLDTDPGVAVGKGDFVISYTGDLLSYRHRDGSLYAKKAKESVNTSFKGVFAPIFPALNQIVGKSFGLACDPAHPDKSQINCINTVYDGRVIYDQWRNRFWLVANSRASKAPKNGPLRFPLVAVTITDDPRDGWFLYVTVEEYSDWPKLSVFEDYVLLGHRASTNLWVYDADLLSKGQNSKLIAHFTQDDFDCDYISVTKQHNQDGHMAIIAGMDASDDDLYVFGLKNPTPGKAGKPVLIQGDGLDLDFNVDVIDSVPVVRNGKLHLVWPVKGDAGNLQVRNVRVPIMTDLKKAEFHTSDDPKDGYRDALIAGEPGGMHGPRDAATDLLDYVKPSLDVTPLGDAVINFAAGSKQTQKPLNWEARYTVFYNDEAHPRPIGVLRSGDCGPLPNENDNANAHVDLSTSQSDPGDHASVWIAHARAEQFKDKKGKTKCGFRTAIGQIKP